MSASEVLDTALAHIAHGFATQQPALVQRADELLSRVAAAAQVRRATCRHSSCGMCVRCGSTAVRPVAVLPSSTCLQSVLCA